MLYLCHVRADGFGRFELYVIVGSGEAQISAREIAILR